MNENIKKLGEQVLKEVAPPEIEFKFQMSPAVQRFAELIIQECCDIISPYTVRMNKPGEIGHPILEIKKHFGVEE